MAETIGMSEEPLPTFDIIGTKLTATTYAELSDHLFARSREPRPLAVDFTNTHIVTMRRSDADFRKVTDVFDYFIPDGMPLIWCMNAHGAGLGDRVYGPAFTRECLIRSPKEIRHYFLGASQDCLDRLLAAARELNGSLTIAGSHHGYFQQDEEPEIFRLITEAKPDFIWIGLGTPKQQEWIARWKSSFPQGVILAVGFAFDVNAGTKSDAPLWMQERGLTWVYRLSREPRRLAWRYFKYNSLFLLYNLADLLTGRGHRRSP